MTPSSNRNTNRWLSNIVDWIPGLGSKKSTMARFKNIFMTRYDERVVLRSTLEDDPYFFASGEISITAESGKGFIVTLPRKLNQDEKDNILEILRQAWYSRQAAVQ